jgi:hypothetical protein
MFRTPWAKDAEKALFSGVSETVATPEATTTGSQKKTNLPRDEGILTFPAPG